MASLAYIAYPLWVTPFGDSAPINSAALELAKQAQDDDAQATALVRRILPKVRAVVLCLTRGSAETPDLINTSLLEVLRALPTFKGTGTLEAWAGGVTYRVTMRQLKRQRGREKRFPIDSAAAENAHEELGQDSPGQASELRDRLQSHLARIPEERRIAVALKIIAGYSVDEVAELTEVPRDTARSRLRLAMQELRESLAKDPSTCALLKEHGYGF